jgi:hypothetical protein
MAEQTETPLKVRNKQQRRKAVAPVPLEAMKNLQLSLFQQVLANTDAQRSELSNVIDLWDATPRYSISRTRMNDMRTAEGFLEVAEIPFQYRGREFTAVIYPARIKDKDGKRQSYYPSAREELVEHALRKISMDQQAGFFDAPTYRSGVKFSEHALRKELEEHGHSQRYDEIVEALDILSLASIEIVATDENGDEPFARSSYLTALTGVRRKDYLADRKAKWAAQFHPLVTQSIHRLTYRQFNYNRLMNCRSQLARWLLSQLVLKFIQASHMTPFEMRYSTIKRDSALLDGYKQQRQAVAALDDAWEELRDLKTLHTVRKNEQRGARSKLEDVIYTLHPTGEFIAEQKAANRRKADGDKSVLEIRKGQGE